jgi:hypothetical protein
MTQRDGPAHHGPLEGGTDERGRGMDPLAPPQDDDEPGCDADAERHVPIGRPMPDAEYERMKRAPRSSPGTGSAQEDPSTG